jgi:hypothetical protein
MTASEQSREDEQLYARRLAMLATPDRFPTIAAGLQTTADLGADYDADEFQTGLNITLDGIQALITRRTKP